MADLKISQLTETNAAAKGDYFIINKSDTTTQKIDYEKLQQTAGGTFDPIIHDFVIDEAACNKAGALTFTVTNNKFLEATYPLGSQFPAGMTGGLVDNVMQTVPHTVTMPAGANRAIVFFEGAVEFGISPSTTDGTGKFNMKTAHRLGMTGATLAIPNANVDTKNGFGLTLAAYFTLVNENQTTIPNRYHRKFFNKYDIISFADSADVTFDSNLDGKQLGRGRLEANSTRILILPFYDDGTVVSQGVGDQLGFRYSSPQELANLYATFSDDDQMTEAAVANDEGGDYRAELRRVLLALESRKNYKVATNPATDAEYTALIHRIWDSMDDPNLYTSVLAQREVQDIFTEATLAKYGITGLFQFERDAGVTQRSIL